MSPAGFRVVARFRDGTVQRGFTADFRPGRGHFTLAPETGGSIQVEVAAAKAIFFVKSFEGDPNHVQQNAFDGEPKVGRCVWVEFLDGERIAGRAPSLREQNGGFFLFPNDTACNFGRAWVVMDSTKEVLFDDEAEVAAASYMPAPLPHGSIGPESWVESPEEGSDAAPMAEAVDASTDAKPASDVPGEPEKSRPRADARPRPHSRADFLGDW